ncbi:MAG: CBS domain-containing protein [Saprospiraceae bacterium]|jgi:acetoin utilization protein AcuB|nr:CBS domain-containing protein [Saprospiraceae bacterium]
MKANTLISKHILPLSLSDHIDTALEKMIEFKVLQLYVLLDQKIIGKVTWQKLSKHNGKESIQQFLETDFQHVSSEDYIFDIWSKMLQFKLNNIPVISDVNQFIGCISENELVKFYLSCLIEIEHGCIILLSMRKMDYSLEKIAQIVEEHKAVILSSFVSEKAERNEIYLSLQINLNDPTSILNDFVRYDIEIVKVFSKQSVQNVHEERYNELMHYLNV